ncbi:MAG: SRPBCC domain-containing protein [Deltaproteobacteria bacterium]
MKLEGDYLFEAKIKDVWEAILDPEVLAATMPGCEKLDLVDGAYVGKLKVKVGPVQGKFDGKVTLEDVKELEGYTVLVDGKGPAGFVKATAHVKLSEAEGGTRIDYDADAKVGGKIASVGQRLVEASAKAVIGQSLEGLHENIKIRAAHAAEQEAETAAPAEEDTPEEAPAEVPADQAETKKPGPAEEPAAPKPAESKPPASKPPLKRVSEADMAAAVAREVSKSFLPQPVIYAIVFGAGVLVGWLLKGSMG